MPLDKFKHLLGPLADKLTDEQIEWLLDAEIWLCRLNRKGIKELTGFLTGPVGRAAFTRSIHRIRKALSVGLLSGGDQGQPSRGVKVDRPSAASTPT